MKKNQQRRGSDRKSSIIKNIISAKVTSKALPNAAQEFRKLIAR
ncbi:MAG: hypothetical protein O2805_11675 [Proteobacteria bacterium]|nr:hypothetical protein [Pseudomonadota bacterium]